jgi:hypothetical protein
MRKEKIERFREKKKGRDIKGEEPREIVKERTRKREKM